MHDSSSILLLGMQRDESLRHFLNAARLDSGMCVRHWARLE
jgi:hypothetical protein